MGHDQIRPWDPRFDRPRLEQPPQSLAVQGCLDGVDPDTRGSYALLPNFAFNHPGLDPRRPADLVLGGLRHRPDDHTVTQHDTSSGERWRVRLPGPGSALSVGEAWSFDSWQPAATFALSGRIEPATGDGDRDGEGDRVDVVVARAGHERRLTRVPRETCIRLRPALFAGIDPGARDREFLLLGGSHTRSVGARLSRVDRAEARLGGRVTTLDCLALVGPRLLPTYW